MSATRNSRGLLDTNIVILATTARTKSSARKWVRVADGLITVNGREAG